MLVREARRGTVLPLLAGCLIALFSFVALAVDLGIVAVARTDAQNAADVAALAGARTLNNKPGVADSNRPAAILQAKAAITANNDVNSKYTNAEIQSVKAGQYNYNTTSQTFAVTYPTTVTTGSWTAMEVVIAVQQPTFFMKVWGVNSMPTGARAVAVHRPRDIALAIDMTGSMGYGSLMRINDKVSSAAPSLNDPSTMWPQFGHNQRYTSYSTTAISGSETSTSVSSRPNPFQQMASQTSAPYIYAPANITIETPNGKPIVRDFYFNPTNISNMANAATSASSSNLRRAFHQWSPGESGADPGSYIGPTYDMTGYNAFDTTGTNGAMPAPDNFKTQTDSPITYVGDKFPKKLGSTSTTSWDPTNANGSAINVAELLGWVNKYSSGSSLSSTTGTWTSGSFVSRTFTGRTLSTSTSNFFDRTWETYGYDMDIADYITRRGSTFDPRSSALPANTTGGVNNQVKVTPGKFKGYSMGPGYFGKTFFIWPPDPRAPSGDPGTTGSVPGDWRRRFFLNRSGSAFNTQGDNDSSSSGTQTINDELLTGGVGDTLRTQSGNFRINYSAVLKWIKSGPMTLPPNLRSGHVLYYTSIPDTTDSSGSDNSHVAADKVFWKNYIDYVLENSSDRVSGWANLAGSEPRGWPEGVTPAIGATTQYSSDPLPYMNYMDNPSRPRLHFWFGPITMMMFLNEYNMWSGTTHQAQSWQLKAGVNSALDDIRNNHPNDYCGMAFFTTPRYTEIMVPIGQDYTTLKNSLFFPKSQLTAISSTNANAELRPYDSGGLSASWGDIPNAQSNTDPVTGMALSYNILSPAPEVNTNPARRGRRGAAKVVIFETDGIPNATQPYNLQKKGYNSYYTYGGSTPITNSSNAAIAVVSQICKDVAPNANNGVDSGFSLPNAEARVYAIGFGDIFSTSAGASAKSFLLDIQQAGNTSADTDTSIPDYQIITGPYQDRIDNLRTALERILQTGVQVTLVE